MDFKGLRDILDAHTSGAKLTLPSGVLESDALDALFEKYLSDRELVVENITARNESEAEASVTVVGTGGGLPFSGLSVEAKFSVVGGRAELYVSANFIPAGADAVWTLDGIFPSLRNSVIPSLHFVAPTALHLASYEVSETVKSGMTFDGTMQPTSGLARFTDLLGEERQTLSGAIEISNGIPVMLLSGPASAEKQVGFFTFPQIFFEIHCEPRYNSRVNSYLPEVYVSFNTTIDFQAQGETRHIPVSAALYNPENNIQFDADLTEGLDAALDELASLANGIGLRGVLPPDLHLEEFLKLTDVGVQVNPTAQNKLVAAKFQVETVKTWPVVKDDSGRAIITVGGIKLLFRLNAPFGSDSLEFTLAGEVGIGKEGVLDVSAYYPGFAFNGALKSGTTVNVKEVLEQILGSSDDRLPDLTVTEFFLFVQPSTSFKFDLDLDGDWSIPLGGTTLKVEEVKLSVEQQQGQGTSAYFEGRFKFANYEFTVKADHQDAGQGWTFQGGTPQGEVLPIGYLLADIAYHFNAELPDFVYDITLENIALSFNTATKDFSFTCEGKFPAGENEVDIVVNIKLTHDGGKFTKELSGKLTVGTLEFDLHFSTDAAATFFAAAYKHTPEQSGLKLKELINNVSPSVAAYIPESLLLDIKDVLFAFSKDGTGTKFLFGVDVGASINLSSLPLVGSKFPADQTVGVDDLQLLVASRPFYSDEAAGLNGVLNLKSVQLARLPAPPADGAQTAGDGAGAQTAKPVAIPDGLTVSATMKFGSTPSTLSLPVAGGTQTGAAATPSTQTTAATTTATATDNAKWFALQKAFGPVYFDKVGVSYQDAAVWFLLNASLSVAGLTLSLDGLAVGSPVNGFDPKFDLRGLGIQYAGGGAVEIGGAFLRIPKGPGKPYDEYDGAALIKAEQLKLSAIGSYAELDGHPSLFVYAVLDYPIGGPSFFFVTGLAAGFGYNRSLLVPAIDQVAQFPLVADALSGTSLPPDVGQKVKSIQQYIPPTVGEYFLAVGIKFTSFKLIDSFALLTVSFGTQFEINLLGLSTLIVPTPIPGQTITPLAEVQLAVRATYNPAQGFLGVAAQLTSNSFILSRDCHLTGGFAFYSWFGDKHKGDFVLTLGGYHPDYNVPTHYPRVPRLGFNWRVDSKLSIKGGAYYALTAAALMAGGSLQATWDSGDLKAHFNAGADFIIYWRPYHYDAKVYVDIGVSYTYQFAGTHHLNVDVGADLHIWGPEFAGTAHIKLDIISFDISFGSGSGKKLKPIDWDTFKESFLPKSKDGGLEICGVSVADGLLGTPSKDAKADEDKGKETGKDTGAPVKVDWIVNPKTFRLVTNSVIPSKEAYKGGAPFALGDQVRTTFGIGPMAVTSADISSRHTVSISRWDSRGGNKEGEDKDGENKKGDSNEGQSGTGGFAPDDDNFDLTPVTKNVPVALWGESLTPSMNGPAFVGDTLSGFEVKPRAQPTPGVTADIKRSALQYETQPVAPAYKWESFCPFVARSFGGADESREEESRRAAVLDTINSDATVARRSRLLGALGVTDGVELAGYGPDDFLIPPQIEAAES